MLAEHLKAAIRSQSVFSLGQTDTGGADDCRRYNPTCSICDQKLTRGNALIRTENYHEQEKQEVDNLAEDLDAQEKACAAMERKLARLLPKKWRSKLSHAQR